MRVKAAVARKPGAPFSLEELDLDEPRSDEVVVEVAAVGLCHTDVAVRNQWLPVPLPLVAGHEGAGVVRAVGDAVTSVVPGDRVVMTYWRCGTCPECRGGHPAYCVQHGPWTTGGGRPDGTNALRDGSGPVHGFFFAQSSFATHAIATDRNIVKVGSDVDLTVAAPLGCGAQTGAGTVMNRLCPQVGATLAVFGTGAVGMSAVMAAHLAGCAQVIAIDVNAARLALAGRLGATHTINATSVDDLVGQIRRIVPRGVDFAIDTSARPTVAAQAFDSLAPRGTLAILGLGPPGTALALDTTRLLTSGRTVTGVALGDGVPEQIIPDLLALQGQGRFPLEELVTTYPLTAINDAVADTESGKVVKAVLLPS
ncbi:MAG: hypothetical protein ABS81_02625 [Pseudonocardia sp. SCN 72-86]|nr:MAG: hypothetical protein ABS81_02625 [Pseudonocardia sp. SCN 72-86]